MAEARHTGAEPGTDDWRRTVERSLTGRDFSTLRSRTPDGITVEPLYAARGDAPIGGLRVDRPWVLVQVVDERDPDRANELIRDDVSGGASGIALVFAEDDGGRGLPGDPGALAIALDGLDLGAVHLRLEPHASDPPYARLLKAFVGRAGLAPERAAIAFGLDPIGPSFRGATRDGDSQDFPACFIELREAGFNGPLATLDGRPFHKAGATPAVELASVLASAAWWVRALTKTGVAPAESVPFLGASVAVDHDQFVSMAKLRALRLLWRQFQSVCGATNSPLPIHAECGDMPAPAAPHTAILRATIAAFAAATGGADSIAIRSDGLLPAAADGSAGHAPARVLARSIQHLLIHETGLAGATDPGAGSGAIESLTDALAERGWAAFQAIEQDGGILAAVSAGTLRTRIAEKTRSAVEPLA